MDADGIHELAAGYALDALDLQEERRFEAHLGRCERCRDQVAAFRETAGALAYDVELPAVPQTLGRRILTAARAERPNVVPLRQRLALPATALGAVAAAAAIALGIWATQLSSSLDKERAARKAQRSVIAVLSDCARTQTQGAHGSICVAPTREAVLTVDGLRRVESGKTYEAWVVKGNRTEPAGLFRGGAGRTYVRLTKPVPKGALVGVTVEKAGGVKAPTNAMVLRAEVKGTA